MTNNAGISGFDYPQFIENGDVPCAETYPDAFFPDEPLDGQRVWTPSYSMEREAKAVCLGCEYQAQCLAYALERPELIGIWGATTEKQRRAIRRGVPVHIGLPRRR